jgi:hypothetical protein
MSSAAFAVRDLAATRYRASRHTPHESAPAMSASSSVAPSAEDALTQLGADIAVLSAHIHAATHRLLVLIAEFDRRRGWEADWKRSCAPSWKMAYAFQLKRPAG